MKRNKKRTDNLINQLLEDNKPVSYTSFIIPTLKFVALSIIYLIVWLFLYYEFRFDIHDKLLTGSFILEILTILSLLPFLAITVKRNLSPQKSITRTHVIIIFTLFAFISFLALTNATKPIINLNNTFYHLHCFANLSLFVIPLSFIGFILFKKHATTHPGWLGVSILSYASILGYFAVRMSCAADALDHQIYMHIIPLIFYGIAGAYLGKKLLHW
jgi:hypothetical protein